MELNSVAHDGRKNNGRPRGSSTYKKFKWHLNMFDHETRTFREGKFCSISHINREMDLKLTSDIVWRLRTHSRTDLTMKNGAKSFMSKYGHIQLTKINESIPPKVI